MKQRIRAGNTAKQDPNSPGAISPANKTEQKERRREKDKKEKKKRGTALSSRAASQCSATRPREACPGGESMMKDKRLRSALARREMSENE
jgi:hypothetical protein